MWAEPELDHIKGISPGPVRYKVFYQPTKGEKWTLLLDYRTFESVKARRLKLVITATHSDQNIGVLEFTAFGKPL